jgi:hypothetical protein
MRQVMPHRNNIKLRRTKCKRNFRMRWKKRFCSHKTKGSAVGGGGLAGGANARQNRYLYDYFIAPRPVSLIKWV